MQRSLSIVVSAITVCFRSYPCSYLCKLFLDIDPISVYPGIREQNKSWDRVARNLQIKLTTLNRVDFTCRTKNKTKRFLWNSLVLVLFFLWNTKEFYWVSVNLKIKQIYPTKWEASNGKFTWAVSRHNTVPTSTSVISKRDDNDRSSIKSQGCQYKSQNSETDKKIEVSENSNNNQKSTPMNLNVNHRQNKYMVAFRTQL